MDGNLISSALEVSRPKTSGPTVNVHVVRQFRASAPDYEQMRKEIMGEIDGLPQAVDDCTSS